jgi:hypothetical protein
MFLWLNVPVLCFHEIYNKYVQGENLQIIDDVYYSQTIMVLSKPS